MRNRLLTCWASPCNQTLDGYNALTIPRLMTSTATVTPRVMVKLTHFRGTKNSLVINSAAALPKKLG